MRATLVVFLEKDTKTLVELVPATAVPKVGEMVVIQAHVAVSGLVTDQSILVDSAPLFATLKVALSAVDSTVVTSAIG
jgi:hypothetical protein